MTVRRTVAVFVHGLFSSEDTWGDMRALLEEDPDLADLKTLFFPYRTPAAERRFYRRIPDYKDLAGQLRTYLGLMVNPAAENLVLVTHSQGGLITQRFLAEASRSGEADKLNHLVQVVMFACPTAGSAFGLKWRLYLQKAFSWHHPQEKALRPLDPDVQEAEQIVLKNFVFAHEVNAQSCPVPVQVFAGASDAIVRRASAHSRFKDYGTLPGGHSEIIRPASHDDIRYLALKELLVRAMSVQPHTATPAGAAAPLRGLGVETADQGRQSVHGSAIGGGITQVSGTAGDVRIIHGPASSPPSVPLPPTSPSGTVAPETDRQSVRDTSAAGPLDQVKGTGGDVEIEGP